MGRIAMTNTRRIADAHQASKRRPNTHSSSLGKAVEVIRPTFTSRSFHERAVTCPGDQWRRTYAVRHDAMPRRFPPIALFQACIYVYGVGVLPHRCSRFADFYGKTVSAGTLGTRTRRVSARRSASAVRGVRHVREIVAISHRLLERACIAQARSRWPVHGRVCCGGDGG